MTYIKYLIYACAIWNLAVFILYGMDKRRAKKRKWRISEKALIVPAFLMGGIGAITGMLFFRHKTKHMKFKILLPLALVFNIAVTAALYYLAISI